MNTEMRSGRSVEERPSVGDALERVTEAGQRLVVRRIDLFVEEARALLQSGLGTAGGAVFALAGWFLIVAGILDVLGRYFPRFAVEIGLGTLHVLLGVAIVMWARSVGAKAGQGS